MPPCPRRRSAELRPAGSKTRQVETTFGPVWLPRRRVRRATCGRHRQPDDALLAAAVGAAQCTPRLRELAARCGASRPDRQAPQIPSDTARQEAGQPIGSAAIEKGVDLVVNRRLKGKRGMKWWRDRAQGVLALRVAQFNWERDQRLRLALAS